MIFKNTTEKVNTACSQSIVNSCNICTNVANPERAPYKLNIIPGLRDKCSAMIASELALHKRVGVTVNSGAYIAKSENTFFKLTCLEYIESFGLGSFSRKSTVGANQSTPFTDLSTPLKTSPSIIIESSSPFPA